MLELCWVALAVKVLGVKLRKELRTAMAARTAAVVLAAGAGGLIGYTVFTGPSEDEEKVPSPFPSQT